jgi:hypothetical protein
VASRLIQFAQNAGKVVEAYGQLAVKVFAFVALMTELIRALVR